MSRAGQPTNSGGRNCTKVLNRMQYRPPTHRITRASTLLNRIAMLAMVTWQSSYSSRTALDLTLFLSHSQSKNKDTNDTLTTLYHRRHAQLQINTRFGTTVSEHEQAHCTTHRHQDSAEPALDPRSSGSQGIKSVAGLPVIKAAFHKKDHCNHRPKSDDVHINPLCSP